MADVARLKQLKIRTGVVKRIAKEKTMYAKESEQLHQRLEKMKADEKDVHDIRKQNEVLQESIMMGPDCVRRLKTAQGELSNLLESESDLAESDEYKAALVVMEESKAVKECQ